MRWYSGRVLYWLWFFYESYSWYNGNDYPLDYDLIIKALLELSYGDKKIKEFDNSYNDIMNYIEDKENKNRGSK